MLDLLSKAPKSPNNEEDKEELNKQLCLVQAEMKKLTSGYLTYQQKMTK